MFSRGGTGRVGRAAYAEPGVSPGGGAEEGLGSPRHAEGVHRRRAASEDREAAGVRGLAIAGADRRGRGGGANGGGCGD